MKKVFYAFLLIVDFMIALGLTGALMNNAMTDGTFIISFAATIIVAILMFEIIEGGSDNEQR